MTCMMLFLLSTVLHRRIFFFFYIIPSTLHYVYEDDECNIEVSLDLNSPFVYYLISFYYFRWQCENVLLNLHLLLVVSMANENFLNLFYNLVSTAIGDYIISSCPKRRWRFVHVRTLYCIMMGWQKWKHSFNSTREIASEIVWCNLGKFYNCRHS